MKAAHDVLERVRSLQRDLIVSMEKLSEAYIELAYYDVSQYKNHTGSTIFLKKVAREIKYCGWMRKNVMFLVKQLPHHGNFYKDSGEKKMARIKAMLNVTYDCFCIVRNGISNFYPLIAQMDCIRSVCYVSIM